MNFKYKHRNKLVSLFVLVSVGLFVMFIVFVIISNKTFETKIPYYTIVDSAMGLQKRPPVIFKGLEIGRITDFVLLDDNKIHANFFIYKEFKNRCIKNSVIQVNSGMLNGEVTNFEIVLPHLDGGTSKEIMPARSLIPNIKSAEGMALVENGIISLPDDGFGGVAQKVNKILETIVLNQTIEKADDGVKNLNAVLISLNAVLILLEKTVANYQAPEGLVERVGGEQLKNILGNLEKTSAYVEGIVGVMHKSRKDIAPILINTNKAISGLNDTLQGVNNNPLIKGGINKDKKYQGVEVND
ncbi:MAG: hypothetical protein A2504_00775 [Bdellovibrionales bacterium RIFOXYD12_FULL_39_22]|nr:MAG: hypothetical protein A2385_03395 [Bdellovibrionales bacterium RIFOXYB1_FULL_39_21]OFZ42628.1 MAG: hypothetical protein A2485_09910 [Bdellovibrionales bacterium RIFOXYC12_FULL_39_17]OFZ47104.1 MAG: hypothetical protein A2404_15385 [Bdellovibrionales bacterium RIFOXYC1_FULL_39_130]OFZ68624.1 MAG: hypothetical protein A2451_16605 [Bdellovibrionales bacterium RIFOXYC2_FULL_39_8]OFZ75352.1 MAG: hypothetical protein A2560_14160 [Bdellovibrionales bacterium RIFOXYD1_FULL_39_84]OFZ93303.1 MAG: